MSRHKEYDVATWVLYHQSFFIFSPILLHLFAFPFLSAKDRQGGGGEEFSSIRNNKGVNLENIA